MIELLRTNRDVRHLFAAQVISYMGDWFAYVALLGLVDELSDSSLLVALVFVAQTVPAFVMSPLTGAVADRFDRRRVLVLVSLGQSVAAAGFLLVGPGRVWLAFVCMGTVSALGAFVLPASQAAVPNLARTPEELQTAAALFGATWGAMLAIGAGLGGGFAAVFGRDAAFVADAVSFLVAAGLVASIRRPLQSAQAERPASRMRPLADMRVALGHARRDRVLLALMSSKATFGLGGGMVVLLAVLVQEDLGGGDAGTGLLIAARGLGAALGPVLATRLVGRSLPRVLLVCGVAGLAFGVGYLLVAASPTLAVAAVLVALAHLGGGAQWTLSTYGLQVRAPDEVRGRILAADFAFVTLILSVSSTSAGAIADRLGPRTTMAGYAVVGMLAGLTYLGLTRTVRARLWAEEEAGLTPPRR